MEDDKNKKSEEKSDLSNVRFSVMPREFRTAPLKKKINKLWFMIGGGVLVLATTATIAVIFVLPKKGTKIVESSNETFSSTSTTSEETKTAATSTQGSLTEKATSTAETVETETAETATLTTAYTAGTDSDSDGLTDKEEKIFQTDSTKPDTDNDTYLDGNEVFYIYNPSGIAPVGLLESGLVKLYRDASSKYQIYYPASWSTSSTATGNMAEFLSPGTEKIILKTEEASSSISLRSWFLSNHPSENINSLQSYTSRQGYQGLQDKNRLATYIKKDDKVFIITYDLGSTSVIEYRRLYDMMLNSLKLE